MPKHEKMRLADPHGISMTVTAVAVVFSALILLYLAFWALGKLMIHYRKAQQSTKPPGTATVAPPVKIKNEGAIVGAEIAADRHGAENVPG
ncbi:MAG: OadG family protein [Alistipes indistinctus]